MAERRCGCTFVLTLVLAGVCVLPCAAIGTSVVGGQVGVGVDIAAAVGAGRFYSAGYDGGASRGGGVVVANIEGGHIWRGHAVLGSGSDAVVTRLIDARATYTARNISFGAMGQVDRHATWVGHVLAGRGATSPGDPVHERGMMPGAELWSGAIATSFSGGAGSGSFSWQRGWAFAEPYEVAFLGAAGGTGQPTANRAADVINSSWGYQSDAGNDNFTMAIDAMARSSRKVFVAAAGNEGSGIGVAGGTMRAPATGYNGISVGAAAADDIGGGYDNIATFSSSGPQDYRGPDGLVSSVRARVDLLAPGTHFTVALYGGATGGNTTGIDATNGSTTSYTTGAQGTSFAAPLVAGGAGLMVDLAYDRFADNSHARDGRVIKAVMLTSARKLDGWHNGQQMIGGALRTSQALDHRQGAGILDLDRAFDVYAGAAATTDLPGLTGGVISNSGWDFGQVSQNGSVDYLFADDLAAGSSITATLNWFVNRQYNGTAGSGLLLSADVSFADLSLSVWQELGSADVLIAESNAQYINTEHLSFTLPADGSYYLRVGFARDQYDVNQNVNVEQFALAWDVVVVPEPGGLVAGLVMITLLRRRGVFRRS